MGKMFRALGVNIVPDSHWRSYFPEDTHRDGGVVYYDDPLRWGERSGHNTGTLSLHRRTDRGVDFVGVVPTNT